MKVCVYVKKIIAIWTVKLMAFACKVLGKKGTSTPGSIGLKLCPDLLYFLAKQVKKEIIVTCGTNGKTTTNNLLDKLIRSNGYQTVCNHVGANMLSGVTTSFALHSSIFGRVKADYACIEIDEASITKVLDFMKPDYMIITNLFRDQLDRFGEIDITIDLMKEGLSKAPDCKLILNGDDPLISSFGFRSTRNCYYFGINENTGVELTETKEGRFCTFCGAELAYKFYHYSQLGDYHCPNCDFGRPDINYAAENLDLEHGLAFDVNGTRIDVNYRGFYNIYNILAALSAASLAGMDMAAANDTLSDYKPQIGRMEFFDFNKPVILNLSKNPTGFNQAISTVLQDTRKKDIIVAINDNARDGRDVSWLWDVDFERLKETNINGLTATGIRLYDMALRFKYAELNDMNIQKDIKAAILESLSNECEVCYVLVNYTALFATQDIIKALYDNYRKEGK